MKIRLPVIPKVQFAFGAVMTALLIVGIVAYRSIVASSESAQWARHTNEVLEHLANLRLGMENIENGYRDFTLSGADAFLEWSRANTSLVDNELRALRALTADNPRQQRRLSVVADLLQRMVQRGDAISRLPPAPGAEDAAAVIRSGRDDPLLDALRVAARNMELEEQQLVRERNSAAVNRFREAQVALIAGSTLALLIAAVSGWQVARDRTERKEAEDRLKRLNRLYAMVMM
jgi:CHASE3 domain sensor protein